jgi:hypothetical protein
VQMKKPSLHDLLCIAITRHKAIDLKKLWVEEGRHWIL